MLLLPQLRRRHARLLLDVLLVGLALEALARALGVIHARLQVLLQLHRLDLAQQRLVPLRLHDLFWRADGSYLAVSHDDDLVEDLRAHPVWLADNYPCAVLHQGPQQQVVQQVLACRDVYRGKGIVNEDRFRADGVGGAGQGDPRALAAGERDAAAADGHHVASGQDLQVGQQARVVQGLQIALLIPVSPIENVFLQRGLADHGHLPVEGHAQGDLEARVLRRRQLPQHRGEQRALPGAHLPHDGHHLPGSHGEVEVREGRLSRAPQERALDPQCARRGAEVLLRPDAQPRRLRLVLLAREGRLFELQHCVQPGHRGTHNDHGWEQRQAGVSATLEGHQDLHHHEDVRSPDAVVVERDVATQAAKADQLGVAEEQEHHDAAPEVHPRKLCQLPLAAVVHDLHASGLVGVGLDHPDREEHLLEERQAPAHNDLEPPEPDDLLAHHPEGETGHADDDSYGDQASLAHPDEQQEAEADENWYLRDELAHGPLEAHEVPVDVCVDELHQAVGLGAHVHVGVAVDALAGVLVLFGPEVVLAAGHRHALRLLVDRSGQRRLEPDLQLGGEEEGQSAEDDHEHGRSCVHDDQHEDNAVLVVQIRRVHVCHLHHLQALHVAQRPINAEGGAQVHQRLVEEAKHCELDNFPCSAEAEDDQIHVRHLGASPLDVLVPHGLEVLVGIRALVVREACGTEVRRLDLLIGWVVGVAKSADPGRAPTDGKPRYQAAVVGVLLGPGMVLRGLRHAVGPCNDPEQAGDHNEADECVHDQAEDRDRHPDNPKSLFLWFCRALKPFTIPRLPQVVDHVRQAGLAHTSPGDGTDSLHEHHLGLELQRSRLRAVKPVAALLDLAHSLEAPRHQLSHVRPIAKQVLGQVCKWSVLVDQDLRQRRRRRSSSPLCFGRFLDLQIHLEKLDECGAMLVLWAGTTAICPA
mmetsp:Transcript_41539/g.120230  ORF Transcript_41539/g.120230 Transcript_41539/m.120230 type:complete len:925 (+) Transcript_41539:2107-4881(+)